MFYINIDVNIKIRNYIFSLSYIDCPDFTFVKRICKSRYAKGVYTEWGIDFSETPYYYHEKYHKGQAPFDIMMYDTKDKLKECQKVIADFETKQIIQKMQNKLSSLEEREIILKLFKEIKLKTQ
jgi:hypothetical protein